MIPDEIEWLRADYRKTFSEIRDLYRNCDYLRNTIRKQTSEIERLRAELARVNRLRKTEINRAGAAERIYQEATRIKELETQVAAIREIAVSELANTLINSPWDGGLPVEASYDAVMRKAKEDARQQLHTKHPEVFQ